jgi:adenosylcobyric acid synthase
MRVGIEKKRAIAVFGTASDVGKSIVATALCRIFSNLGMAVAPFKAQNMSNNSFVTQDGGEMGRAQAVQAQAARVEPHVDMNPVLLKPSTDVGSQLVLHGMAVGNVRATEYFRQSRWLFEKALKSFRRLCSRYDLIVIEGAGSCAEVNLMDRDFVNFQMAHVADAPVILVADIDRGGVFAQIVGTFEVLPPADRNLIKGLIINRFRGEPKLFADGIRYIEEKTGAPVLGLIPYFHHLRIDSEDSVVLDRELDPPGPQEGVINIAVLRLPHVSNFTDFSPMQYERGVGLHYLSTPRYPKGYQLVILPGTKNVRSDLAWMRRGGWDRVLYEYREAGGEIGGICGGYQMLGRVIRDPYGVEGNPGETNGLGLLDVETTLQRKKTLSRTIGLWLPDGSLVNGYEIHMGTTSRGPHALPLIEVSSRDGKKAKDYDGAYTPDGKVWGTYLHGLFDSEGFRRSLLRKLNPDFTWDDGDLVEDPYDALARHFSAHLDPDRLFEVTDLEVPEGPGPREGLSGR